MEFRILTGTYVAMYIVLATKQKHLGCKKCEANQKQHCKQVRPKTLISVEAKKLLIKIFFTT